MSTSAHHSTKKSRPQYFRNVEVDPASRDCENELDNINRVFDAMDALMKTPTLVGGAVMPDACPTGEETIPVGGVVVAKNAIHPGFHSADICCSVMATYFGSDVDATDLLDIAQKVTHFGKGGRKRSAGVFKRLTPQLIDRIGSNPFFDKSDLKKAQLHLGTQGDGNHFLYVGRSEASGNITLVTHHGSRAFGASLYEKGMSIAENYRQSLAPEIHPENAWIPADSTDGHHYWEALQIVRDWTKLNHQVIHQLVDEKLGNTSGLLAGESGRSFWNEHNFVFRSEDSKSEFGPDHFFHAKGATPLDQAFLPDSPDGLRLIPLNMGQPILVSKGGTGANNLGFAPHGAGRNMTRSRHKQIRRSAGQTDDEIFEVETRGIDVRFFSGRVDISELPSAYKDADEVQRQIDKFKLCNVVDRIHPHGCIMAGTNPAKNQRKR